MILNLEVGSPKVLYDRHMDAGNVTSKSFNEIEVGEGCIPRLSCGILWRAKFGRL